MVFLFRSGYQNKDHSLALLNSWDSYEEDLKLWIGRPPQKIGNFFLFVPEISLLACLVPDIAIKKTSKSVSYLLKFSLLAYLIHEIAMKKTSTMGYGRRPHKIWNISWFFLLINLKSSYIPKISLLACLVPEISMKKTSKLKMEDDLSKFETFSWIFLPIWLKSSSISKISLLAFDITKLYRK